MITSTIRDSNWLPTAIYSVVGFLVITASYTLGLNSNNLLAIWPAAGVCAWVAVRYGWKCAIVVFASHHGHAMLLNADKLDMYLAFNIGNVFAYLIALKAYRSMGGTTRVLSSVRQTLLFIVAFAVGMSLVSGLAGALAYVYFMDAPTNAYMPMLWRWVLSDFAGVILFAPAFIAAHPLPTQFWRKPLSKLRSTAGLALGLSIAVLCGVVVLTLVQPFDLGDFPIILLIMPLCIWLALNDAPRISSVLLTATATGTLALMLLSQDFAAETTFFAAQPYLVILMLTSMVIRAASTERAVALDALSEERSRLEDTVAERTSELKDLADSDALTGLANRRCFERSLERVFTAVTDQEAHSYLLYIDLDQFKIVNDTSGHAAGDAVLKHVASLLQKNLRKSDVIGRLGGDEFAALLHNCPEAVARRIAETIRREIDALRVPWETETHKVGASIGCVLVDPAHGTIADIMQLADHACYAAKNAGRNRVHMADISDSVVAELRGDLKWAHRLNDAMENNHFVLFGHRIASIKPEPDEPEHIEILLRMRDHKAEKYILPGAFLPAAERYGLATRLDEWVVKELIRSIYVHSAFNAAKRRYWVNLSGASVGDERFVDFLIDTIDRSPLDPGLINFEITETAVIRNVDEASRLMARLGELGCQFALDDFGTGLSSFSHLKKLPVDHLKIDGMFVKSITTDTTDSIFVKSIIDIAHNMGIKAVVEFVENQEILDKVTEMGADFGQGYGIQRPAPLKPAFDDASEKTRLVSNA